jgi:hypothetical protein
MEATLEKQIKSAVLDWATLTYHTQEIVIGSAAQDPAEYARIKDLVAVEDETFEDDAGRYLVDYAVRDVGRWLVAEVWLTGQEIFSVNDMGEGLPLDDIRWPWPLDETP